MNRVIKTLSATSLQALQALSIYRFLTVSQFVKLGIGKSEPSVRNNILPRLYRTRPALTKRRKLGQFLPEVHYMTEHGARYLAEAFKQPLQDFPYPKGQVQFGEMFARHRFAQIDFHIGFRQWVKNQSDTEILFADMDFDIIGSRRHGNFEKKTEIRISEASKPVIPDGIFGVTVNGNPMIFILEVHRTTQTKQVATQIKQYIDILESGAIATKYNIEIAPIICSVHMQDNVLKGVKTELQRLSDFHHFRGAFLFNSFNNVKSDICAGWTFADDATALPFKRN